MRQSAPIWWKLLWPVRAALAPAYWAGLNVHKALYGVGLKKRYRPPVPVICIGNLSTGGTGKTPLVIAIVEMLQSTGRKVGVLTRGYKSGQKRLAVRRKRTHVDKMRVTPDDVGDEAFLLTEKLEDAHVLVGPNRAASARLAVEELGCDVLVMDDGFQHWSLERDLDVVLLDASRPPGFNHLMPWGNLREGWGALRRAHVAVITKAPDEAARMRATERAVRINPKLTVWQVEFVPGEIKRLADGAAIDPASLEGQPVLLTCGLASPDGFERTARSLGCTIKQRFFYRDHFVYPDIVIRYLEIMAQKAGARCILTTEKDAVKLRGRTAPNAPWAVVGIEANWLESQLDGVRAFLSERLPPGPGSRI